MHKQSPIVFGEVLFDHFPDGSRVLGGAPFNVAWHLQALGLPPRLISRIGDDDNGCEIADLMQQWGMSREALQIDAQHPTGSVQVGFEAGEPHYEIVENSAYDFIDAAEIVDVTTYGILYHGSLALRNPVAFAALQRLKALHQGKIFLDVNLRAPWWQRETLISVLHDADWVKLNQAELLALCPDGSDLETTMSNFCQHYALETLVVTLGEQGALACDQQGKRYSVKPVAAIPVVDTVGAGDAFAAVLLLGLQQEWPLEMTLQRAQALASALVGRRGATVADRNFYELVSQDWS